MAMAKESVDLRRDTTLLSEAPGAAASDSQSEREQRVASSDCDLLLAVGEISDRRGRDTTADIQPPKLLAGGSIQREEIASRRSAKD